MIGVGVVGLKVVGKAFEQVHQFGLGWVGFVLPQTDLLRCGVPANFV